MGENIRLPAIDSLYSKGRHHNISIICVGHTVTDLNTKARDNTPAIYITLNSSQQFFERVQEKFKIDSNLYRFKHYKYGKINYNNSDTGASRLQYLQPRSIIFMYKHFIFYVIYLLPMYIRKPNGANCSVYATC